MSYRTENYESWVPLIENLPVGTYYEVSINGKEMSMQAGTQAAVKRVMSAFPGCIWQKAKDESIGWWSYTTALSDERTLKIYADREGPKSCKRVEETVEERVLVLAQDEHYETRKRTKVRWECPEPNEEEEVAS